MRLLTKIVVAVESTLITSAVCLWSYVVKIPIYTRVTWISLSEEAKRVLGLTEPYLKVTTVEGQFVYPYQTIAMIALIVAGIIGVVYWKLPKNHKKKHMSYAERFFKKHPNL